MASRRLEVVIAGDASGATRAMGQVEQRSQKASRSLLNMNKIGRQLAGVFAGIQIGQFLRGAISEAEEAQTVMRQTNAVIESTGGVAGISADHLQGLADRLSRIAAVDGEVIQQGGNVLLTFKNIKAEGGIFDDALTAALDMSSALGTDLQPAVLAIGKALNNPAAGLSRLTRMGVEFTDQQKEQIEAMVAFGDVAGAQRIILAELQSEFGGAAEANATASMKFQTAMDDIKESIGTGLLPAVEGLADATAKLQEGFEKLSGPLQTIISIVAVIGAAFVGLAAVFGATVAAITVAGAAGIAVMVGIWYATQPLRDLFFAVVDQLRQWWNQSEGIRQSMAQIAAQVFAGLRSAVSVVISAFQTWWAMTGPIRGVLNVIGSIALLALRGAVGNVITLVRTLWQLSQPARDVLRAIGSLAWSALKSAISTVRSALQTVWEKSQPVRDVLRTIGNMALSALTSAVSTIRSAFERISSVLDTIASKIRSLPSPSISMPSWVPGGSATGNFLSAGQGSIVNEFGRESFFMAPTAGRVMTRGETLQIAKAGASGGGSSEAVIPEIRLFIDGVETHVTKQQRGTYRARLGAGGTGY